MLPLECPAGWEYEHLSGARQTVAARAARIFVEIRASSAQQNLNRARDTRADHERLFAGLTPPGFPKFAGHYRGEPVWCLDLYEVQIASDSRVGYKSQNVPASMESFAQRMLASVTYVNIALDSLEASDARKLVQYASVIAALFVEFLEIHPYANGNGHMGRMLLIALFAMRGVYPNSEWQIDPRPKDPPYSNLIARYRDGDQIPLVQFILAAL